MKIYTAKRPRRGEINHNQRRRAEDLKAIVGRFVYEGELFILSLE